MGSDEAILSFLLMCCFFALKQKHRCNLTRRLERRRSVRELARCPVCHPERSEGSRCPSSEILRCAQDDTPSLQMSCDYERLYRGITAMKQRLLLISLGCLLLAVFSSCGSNISAIQPSTPNAQYNEVALI